MKKNVVIISASAHTAKILNLFPAFDARAIKNPYHDRRLRALNGLDPRVQEEVSQYLDWNPELHAKFLSFVKEGKERGELVFICHAGRHRSVALAEKAKEILLAEGLREEEVEVIHLQKGESW